MTTALAAEAAGDPLADLLGAVRAFSEGAAPIDFMVILDHWDLFARGLVNTVTLVAAALALGAALALPMAVARAYRTPLASPLVAAFVYLFRGTPLLVQAYLIYYGLAQFGAVRHSLFWPVLRDAWWCALIAFTVNTAAYQVEIYRGGLQAVPRGEVEAARSVGMSGWQVLRRIILPSGLRRCLPMIGNETIFMIHGSVIASTLTVIDVLGAGRALNARYYLAYEGFVAASVIYMALIFAVTRLFRRIERAKLAHLAPCPA